MMFYVIAVLIGVWQTLRKLDIQQREPEQYPNVDRDKFETWKTRAIAAHNLASIGCFAYIPLDLALRYGAPSIGIAGNLLRVLHLILFLLWLGAIIGGSVLSSRAKRLQRDLGVVLASRAPEPDPPE